MISDTDKSYLKTGFKEVLKLIEKNETEKVFIAEDVSQTMKDKLLDTTSKNSCEVIFVDSMKTLGGISGIDVGASCAAIKKH